MPSCEAFTVNLSTLWLIYFQQGGLTVTGHPLQLFYIRLFLRNDYLSSSPGSFLKAFLREKKPDFCLIPLYSPMLACSVLNKWLLWGSKVVVSAVTPQLEGSRFKYFIIPVSACSDFPTHHLKCVGLFCVSQPPTLRENLFSVGWEINIWTTPPYHTMGFKNALRSLASLLPRTTWPDLVEYVLAKWLKATRQPDRTTVYKAACTSHWNRPGGEEKGQQPGQAGSGSGVLVNPKGWERRQ